MNKYAINTLLTDFTLMRGGVNIFFFYKQFTVDLYLLRNKL
jgi:hypothetical protein